MADVVEYIIVIGGADIDFGHMDGKTTEPMCPQGYYREEWGRGDITESESRAMRFGSFKKVVLQALKLRLQYRSAFIEIQEKKVDNV